MRAVLTGLLALTVCLGGMGCVVASSTRHAVWGKSAVVLDDEIYVVDLKTHTARKVTVAGRQDADTSEVTVIETQTDTW